MSRRLPIYLLLDVSGSMTGEPIEAVKTGLQMMKTALRNNPQASETAYVSVITFGKEVKQVEPLVEVLSFTPPNLEAEGETPLGQALKSTSECVVKEVRRSTPNGPKGDYKPMVFLLTDGQPTDKYDKYGNPTTIYQEGLAAFNAIKWSVKVGCAAGPRADDNILNEIILGNNESDSAWSKVERKVVRLAELNPQSIGDFFKWVSDSIEKAAGNVATGESNNSLPEPPPQITYI